MGVEYPVGSVDSSGGPPGCALLGSLRTAMSAAEVPERCRLLATLFSEFTAQCENGSAHRGAPADQVAALAKRIQELEKRKADIEDIVRTTEANLAHREKQLEAERTRSEELLAISNNQRARLESVEAEITSLEAELVNKNHDFHRLASENETLQVKLQRAQLASSDTSRSEALEEDKRQLAAHVEALQADMEQLRKDKNEEIERLKGDLARTQTQSSQSAEAMLASLWRRLAETDPAIVTEPHIQPTAQAGERLVDAFIVLAGFVHKFDQDMRTILDRSTHHNQEIRKLWNVYREQCDLCQTLRQTVAPTQGKHVGALKMQLRICRNWAFAEMVSSDSAIEWVAEELRSHLLGPLAAGTNPKYTVKDYVRMNGPDLFLEHIRKLRGQKLAELYGHGA